MVAVDGERAVGASMGVESICVGNSSSISNRGSRREEMERVWLLMYHHLLSQPHEKFHLLFGPKEILPRGREISSSLGSLQTNPLHY